MMLSSTGCSSLFSEGVREDEFPKWNFLVDTDRVGAGKSTPKVFIQTATVAVSVVRSSGTH